MNQDKFIEELKKINIDITSYQLKQLDKYYQLLVEYNKQFNLTAITEKKDVYLKHFYDSLTLTKIIDLNKINYFCDVGTGAGFPGIVLKILFPNLKITLIDSLNKRVNFLNVVINELKLTDIEAIHTRAEEYSMLNRNKFDITTSRAVSNLSNLLEYNIPMTKENGYFIALKGNVENELVESENALKELNTIIDEKIVFNLPYENSIRTIIKFKKIKDNKKYPRKYSEIKKHRL